VHFTFSIAYKESQYCVYDYVQLLAPQITQDTRPTMVNDPLTLIFMMGQGAVHLLFCLLRQPIHHL
jgi:hypothetical protein